MPEGDSLFRAARALHEAPSGEVIIRFASPRPELKEQGVEGHVVTRVRAQGKYVVLELDDGRGLLSHLRMQGRWLVYEKAALSAKHRQWLGREPRWDDEQTTLILESKRAVAVLELAAVAELAPLATIERRLAYLGPDVLSADFDETEVLSRLRQHPELTVAEALMLQSAVAGIGNVYKSETL